MARENQGLQIALIIFVILTIGLGVTTFMFFKQADDANLRAKANEESEAKKGKELQSVVQERSDLMKFIGVPPTDPIAKARDTFNADMQLYGSAYPEPTRFYSSIVKALHEDLKQKNDALAAEQATVKDLADKLKRLDEEKQPQIAASLEQAKKAGEDLASRTRTFDDDRKRLNDEKDELVAKFERSKKDAEKSLTAVQGKLEDVAKAAGRFRKLYVERTEQLEQATKQEFETAEGKIRWVNQHNGTVWINLGQADNLLRQTKFSVYSADTNDVTKAAKKASIEVTQILGEHLAEARIVEDSISDPIMPNDVIYTPLWRPGEQIHVALAGLIDIDGDGTSDLKMLLNLISMNGAVADLYIDDNGKKVGKMTTATRFLVLGKTPEATGKVDKSEEGVNVYSQVLREARELGIKTMPLGDLLKRMGFKNETHVVRYGRGMNVDDFKPRAPEGAQKTGTGAPSALYQTPQRPRGSAGGAY